MKRLGQLLLAGFLCIAIYGAIRPILITSTNMSATLFKAAMPIGIGVAVIVGIIMVIAAFGKGIKGGG